MSEGKGDGSANPHLHPHQETIKIKLIDDQFKTQEGGPRFKGFFHGVKTIVSEEGLAGIYHGLSPTILKVATAQASRSAVACHGWVAHWQGGGVVW